MGAYFGRTVAAMTTSTAGSPVASFVAARRLIPFIVLLAVPAAAQANTISAISVTAPRAEVPTTISVTGTVTTLPDGANIFAITRAAGGPPCAARPAHDPGQAVSGLWGTPVSGPFLATEPITFSRSGNHVVCAWIADGLGSSVIAVGQANVFVGRAVAGLAVKAPKRVRAGATMRIVVTGSTEAGRDLVVKARPSRGPAACGPSPQTDRGEWISEQSDLLGQFRHPLLVGMGYTGMTVCAWLVTTDTDPEPLARARAFIRLKGPRPPADPIYLE
jgi:hypothetical protein